MNAMQTFEAAVKAGGTFEVRDGEHVFYVPRVETNNRVLAAITQHSGVIYFATLEAFRAISKAKQRSGVKA